MNIDAYHEAAEHFLGALVVQGAGPGGAGSSGTNDSDPLWSTLQRTFVLMVRLSRMNAGRGARFADEDIFDFRTEAIWRRSREGGGMLRTLGRGGSISSESELDEK